MGRSRKQLWELGAALLAMAFTGFAQNVKPPVSIVIRAPQNIKVGSTVKPDITMTNVSNRVVEGSLRKCYTWRTELRHRSA
jgi:hypothetical protein